MTLLRRQGSPGHLRAHLEGYDPSYTARREHFGPPERTSLRNIVVVMVEAGARSLQGCLDAARGLEDRSHRATALVVAAAEHAVVEVVAE